MGKRALFQDKVALFGVVQPKNLGHYFRVALFVVALFGVLLYFKIKVNDFEIGITFLSSS